MTQMNTLSARTFAASFVGLTLVCGAWTIANAPVAQLPGDVISGAAQRHYEQQFDDAFPQRDAVRQAWTAVKFAALGEVANGALLGQGGVLFTAEEFTAPAETRPFAVELSAARTAVEATGAQLIPVIIPDKARMMSDSLSQDRSARFRERYDAALNVIAQEGLSTIDLRPALRQPGSYMRTDTHWSPAGAQAAAARIATHLDGQITETSPFQTQRTGTAPFSGDLMAFADTGVWRSYIGPSAEEIATFETNATEDAGLGLFDDVQVPAALVGTSFSARADFHFVDFLKSELGADVLSYAIEGRGPFHPMDTFLNTLTTMPTPPQLVLWEIPERYLNTWSQDQ